MRCEMSVSPCHLSHIIIYSGHSEYTYPEVLPEFFSLFYAISSIHLLYILLFLYHYGFDFVVVFSKISMSLGVASSHDARRGTNDSPPQHNNVYVFVRGLQVVFHDIATFHWSTTS